MRKLFLVLLLTFSALPTRAIALVQKKETENAVSVTTFNLAYTSTVTAGNELIAVVRLGQAVSSVTVSDNVNAGNWTQAFLTEDTTNVRWLGIFYKENTGAGTITVTLSWTTSDSTTKGLDIFEYSGLVTSSSLDQQNSGVSLSVTNPTSGNITTTNASDLLIGAITFSTSQTATVQTESTGFAAELNDTLGTASHNHLHVADDIVSSTGTFQYQPTLSAAQVSVVGVAAFKGTGGAAAPTGINMQRKREQLEPPTPSTKRFPALNLNLNKENYFETESSFVPVASVPRDDRRAGS